MKILIQQGSVLQQKLIRAGDISFVVCYSDDGEPLVVIEQVGREVVQITRAGERSFESILRRVGALKQEVPA